jgi:hypothetical protein
VSGRSHSIGPHKRFFPDRLLDERLLVIEVCCTDLEYVTANLLDEAEIADVHKVIAVTPTVDLKRALAKMVNDAAERRDEPAVKHKVAILAACNCTKAGFGWQAVLDTNRDGGA